MNVDRNYDGTNFITGLRAIAVLMVFLIHSGGGGLRDLGYVFNNIVDSGKHGVEIFFVISGFTIYYQFLKAGYNPNKFVMVRFLRISIPYFALLLLLGLLILLDLYTGADYWLKYFGLDGVSIKNYILHFFYYGAIDPAFANTMIGVEWTLNVEAFMYLLFFALALLVKSMFNFKWTVLLFFTTGILYVIGLIVSSNFFDVRVFDSLDSTNYHFSPFKWMFLFFLGGVAYHVRYKLIDKDLTGVVIGLSLLIFMLAMLASFSSILLTLIVSVITFLILVGVKDNDKYAFLLSNKAFMFIGSISFSFYLINFIVIRYVGTDGVNDLIIALIITMLFSFIWYILFEKIMYTRLKKKVLS